MRLTRAGEAQCHAGDSLWATLKGSFAGQAYLEAHETSFNEMVDHVDGLRDAFSVMLEKAPNLGLMPNPDLMTEERCRNISDYMDLIVSPESIQAVRDPPTDPPTCRPTDRKRAGVGQSGGRSASVRPICCSGLRVPGFGAHRATVRL